MQDDLFFEGTSGADLFASDATFLDAPLNTAVESIALPAAMSLEEDLAARLLYFPKLIEAKADDLFKVLAAKITWQQDTMTLYGKRMPIPRLQAWFSDDAQAAYTYSELTMQPAPMPQCLRLLNQTLFELTGLRFNAVLANYYRDGQDSVAFHADDEPELGLNPVIASVSLGAHRSFILKSKPVKDRMSVQSKRQKLSNANRNNYLSDIDPIYLENIRKYHLVNAQTGAKFNSSHGVKSPTFVSASDAKRCKLELQSGSLLIMGPGVQEQYVHAIPKQKDVLPRINLTFRYINNTQATL